MYARIGVSPPRGLLLHGPPGCGKTALANAIANQCGVPFLRISAPEIVSGMSGERPAAHLSSVAIPFEVARTCTAACGRTGGDLLLCGAEQI